MDKQRTIPRGFLLMIVLLLLVVSVLLVFALRRNRQNTQITDQATEDLLFHSNPAAAQLTENADQNLPSADAGTPCPFTWATQPLPDITADVATLLRERGVEVLTIDAIAFGENGCFGGEVTSGAMQTDYEVTVSYDASPEFDANLNMLLRTLAEIPASESPGPNLGRLMLRIDDGEIRAGIPIPLRDVLSAIEDDVAGDLLAVLNLRELITEMSQ